MIIEHKKPIKFHAIHESNHKFNSLREFDRSLVGTNTNNNGLYGVGVYVTTKHFKCGGYGIYKNKVFVELECPFVISKPTINTILNRLNVSKAVENTVNFHLNLNHPHFAFQILMRGLDTKVSSFHNEKMTSLLQGNGYDGVIFAKDKVINEAVIFFNSKMFN